MSSSLSSGISAPSAKKQGLTNSDPEMSRSPAITVTPEAAGVAPLVPHAPEMYVDICAGKGNVAVFTP